MIAPTAVEHSTADVGVVDDDSEPSPPAPTMTCVADLDVTILIAEDDAGIASALLRAFASQGYRCEHVTSGADVRRAVRAAVPDLVVLDLGLPDEDGLDICRDLANSYAGIRILCLTARAEEIDVVLGLDAGAVDYVTKPFRLAELLARVRAQLRIATPPGTGNDRLVIGPLVLDTDARRVWLNGCELPLRAKEFDLLMDLAEHRGKVVTREDLMSRVWDEHWFGSTKTLDVHIASLRKKLGDDGDESGGLIATVRGVGYRLDDPGRR